ncbi:protein required for cell viability Rrp17 [Cladophialophora carrionii]|uniref:Protein required for cell viability Rrp17 n=1 Tax=Cladophialophora carrionii TaxID=86049 RepID=A0A1C1CDF8_9EURO|nr:protein required for cell viability Rrp17 [Cladophialophora carrionii]
MPPPTKRRRLEPTVVEEIAFDPAARYDFLTGFHKRKLQRAKHAQEAAERRARAEKLEGRKQLREQRKAELERHVEEVNALLGLPAGANDKQHGESNTDSDEEWEGISDSDPPPIDHEAEYVDEEKYTTVTVEALDVSKEGLFRAQQDSDKHDPDNAQETSTATNEGTSSGKQKRPWTKEKPKDGVKKRKKKRNFRYEGKAERKEARAKQKSRNSRQARERRAGGS